MSEFERAHIRAYKHPWSDSVDILIREIKFNKMSVGVNVTMQEIEEGAIQEPTMRLSGGHAQQLMDDLWQAGIRPSEGSGSAGQLSAVQKHLEDVRQLLFKQLQTEKP